MSWDLQPFSHDRLAALREGESTSNSSKLISVSQINTRDDNYRVLKRIIAFIRVVVICWYLLYWMDWTIIMRSNRNVKSVKQTSGRVNDMCLSLFRWIRRLAIIMGVIWHVLIRCEQFVHSFLLYPDLAFLFCTELTWVFTSPCSVLSFFLNLEANVAYSSLSWLTPETTLDSCSWFKGRCHFCVNLECWKGQVLRYTPDVLLVSKFEGSWWLYKAKS